MSQRFASADSVVLPVPDRPNRIDASPLSRPYVAEQCIESTPFFGIR